MHLQSSQVQPVKRPDLHAMSTNLEVQTSGFGHESFRILHKVLCIKAVSSLQSTKSKPEFGLKVFWYFSDFEAAVHVLYALCNVYFYAQCLMQNVMP